MTSQDAILSSLAEYDRLLNPRPPPPRSDEMVFGRYSSLKISLPPLLNHPDAGAPLPCRESPAEFETIFNAHFSAQIHAFFNALHDLEVTSTAASQTPSTSIVNIQHPSHQQPSPPPPPPLELELTLSLLNQSFHPHLPCLHRAFHTYRLTILNPHTLPLLTRVTKLRILPNSDSDHTHDAINTRPISLATPIQLATGLPHLRELDCPWLGERLPVAFTSKALRIISRVWEGPWRDDRLLFARTVRGAMANGDLPISLGKVRFWFWRPVPHGDEMDQGGRMADLVGSSSSLVDDDEFGGMDPVSLGLRNLGSRLEELDVRALVTSDLFPSSSSSSSSSSPSGLVSDNYPLSSKWPHMRHLKVEFHPCSPDGKWYFCGPRGEDPETKGFVITREEHYPPGQENDEETHELMSDEEEKYAADAPDIYDLRSPDMFRLRPIPERVNPLLLAFASSLEPQRMPALRDAELFTWLTWRPSKERAKEYEGSDEVPPTECDNQVVMFRWGLKYEAPVVGEGDGKGKVTWQVGEDWRPEDRVMKAFENLVGGDGENMEWKAFEFVEEREEDPEDYI
ncbi:hypothetical protein B0T20DRAFT_384687 [Sordaria brevicollis]|uniref:Uncharacterized protein n=1 Tax=Sordaria brevicollis TaxID=83679 RepID=A0AAE0P297_SORBR|nr:hypothetical protein B0T20DRAFT_384687 [Sordaria brevicollis]